MALAFSNVPRLARKATARMSGRLAAISAGNDGTRPPSIAEPRLPPVRPKSRWKAAMPLIMKIGMVRQDGQRRVPTTMSTAKPRPGKQRPSRAGSMSADQVS